jgi:hypothetical protein
LVRQLVGAPSRCSNIPDGLKAFRKLACTTLANRDNFASGSSVPGTGASAAMREVEKTRKGRQATGPAGLDQFNPCQ